MSVGSASDLSYSASSTLLVPGSVAADGRTLFARGSHEWPAHVRGTRGRTASPRRSTVRRGDAGGHVGQARFLNVEDAHRYPTSAMPTHQAMAVTVSLVDGVPLISSNGGVRQPSG